VPTGVELPCPTIVEGFYAPARRSVGNVLEFVDYLSLARITATGENTIQLQFFTFSALYEQTEPYVFHLISTDDPIMRAAAGTLRFRMVDGQVTHIMLGNGFDFTTLPQGRTMPFLIGSVAVVIIAFAFFLIMPIVLLISFIRKREKVSRLNLFTNSLLLCGTLLALNQIILVVLGLVFNAYSSLCEVTPHIWVNYGLLVMSIGLLIASAASIIKGEKLKLNRLVLYCLTILFLLLLNLVLWNWNFFVLL
jgi:hypothetical protein